MYVGNESLLHFESDRTQAAEVRAAQRAAATRFTSTSWQTCCCRKSRFALLWCRRSCPTHAILRMRENEKISEMGTRMTSSSLLTLAIVATALSEPVVNVVVFNSQLHVLWESAESVASLNSTQKPFCRLTKGASQNKTG